jgi:uncharacterized protein YggE
MFRKKALLGAVSAASLLMVLPGVALAAPPDTITVSASATTEVKPDLGTVVFGVHSRSASASKATSILGRRTHRVVRALKNLGLSGDDISTEGITLVRVCLRDCRDPHPHDNVPVKRVMGYRGSAGIRIETTHLKKMGVIVDTGVAAGATSIRSVFFAVKDKSQAVNDALSRAMDIAIAKATTLANEAGRTLGQASTILEGRTTQPRAYAFSGSATYASVVAAPQANPFPVKPPLLSASGHIEVTFLLQ